MINIIGDDDTPYKHLSNLKSGRVLYGAFEFKTIEHAYQFTKACFFDDLETAYKIFHAKSGYYAKFESKKIVNNTSNISHSSWDKVKYEVIEDIMRVHYFDIRNTDKKELLLSTGDNVLTHKHKKLNLGEWETEFPRILMKIREELKPK